MLGKKILIADDDPRNVFIIASALEKCGANIIEVFNGKDVLIKLKEQNVDIILMDVTIPEMAGYQNIRNIRNNQHMMHIPIIALTAKSLKGNEEKCIESGANDFISKPVDLNILITLINAWLNNR